MKIIIIIFSVFLTACVGSGVTTSDHFRYDVENANGEEAKGIIAQYVASGGDINAHGGGWTALFRCLMSETCADDTLRHLLNSGADIKKLNFNTYDGVWDTKPVLHYLSSYPGWAHKSKMRILVEEYNVPVDGIGDSPPGESITALQRAAISGNIEAIKILIELGADPNYQSKKWPTFTSLGHAAHFGEIEAMELLMELGADPNLVQYKKPPGAESIAEILKLHYKAKANIAAEKVAKQQEKARERRASKKFWSDVADFIDATASAVHRSSGASSSTYSNSNTSGADASVDRSYNEAMDRINSAQKAHSKPQNQSQQISAHPQDAEKQNCIAAGKRWTGSSCDYSTSVTVQGWTSEKSTRSSSPSLSGESNSSKVLNVNDSSVSSTSSGNSQGSGTAQGNSSQANNGSSEKKAKRYIPVFVTKEGPNSWKSQEDACTYGMATARRKAEAICKNEHNGRTAMKSEAPIPVDANCQSCRTTAAGNWKCSGNVILQCLLP